MVLPAELRSVKDLRLAAAQIRADMLVVYTFDTAFRVKDHDVGPLGIVTLGFLANHEAMLDALGDVWRGIVDEYAAGSLGGNIYLTR